MILILEIAAGVALAPVLLYAALILVGIVFRLWKTLVVIGVIAAIWIGSFLIVRPDLMH